jgi:hypothetical protein
MKYPEDLIKLAAVAIAAAQLHAIGHTAVDATNNGVIGRFAMEEIMDAVREERRQQGVAWGTLNAMTIAEGYIVSKLREAFEEVIGNEI